MLTRFSQYFPKRPILVPAGLFLFLIGCSHAYQIDLAEQRKDNLSRDQAFLAERQKMEFEEPLTLDDAISVGLSNNLDLRVSRFMERIADRTAMSEKLKMLPSLTAQGVYSERSEFIQREFVDPDTGEVSLSNTVSQDKTTKTFDLSLSWNILDFGLSYIRSRQAALQTEIRRMERIRQAQNLAMDIASAFWNSVLSEQDLEYVRDIEGRMRQYKSAAEELVAEKRLDPIVAKEMERQLVNLTISAADLQAEIATSRVDLSRLMGLTPTSRFDVDPSVAAIDRRLETIPSPGELNARRLEDVALRNRPELFSADLRNRVQEDEIRAAFLDMFPGLELNASYHYDGDQFLVNNDWYTAGGQFVASLLQLPSKYANWNAQKMTAEMVEIQRVLLTAGIVAQVHVALQDFGVKKRQFELKEAALQVSDDLRDMSQERNRAGMIGFSDTVVAQRMMESFLARLERNRTAVSLLNAYHTLLVSLGLGYERWSDPMSELDAEEISSDIDPDGKVSLETDDVGEKPDGARPNPAMQNLSTDWTREGLDNAEPTGGGLMHSLGKG